MTLVSTHPELVAARKVGGTTYRALERDRRLKSLVDEYRRSDGGFELRGELLGCFERVFVKTIQGLFFGLYQRVVPKEQLSLVSIEDRQLTTVEEVVERVRPNPLRDITDKPLPAITPSSWPIREPIIMIDSHPNAPGQEPVRRIFRLVRETKVKWIKYQPDIFTLGVVKGEDGKAVCILDVWQTLVVVVAAPWPDGRGPLRRGRKNPLSRDRTA